MREQIFEIRDARADNRDARFAIRDLRFEKREPKFEIRYMRAPRFASRVARFGI